MCCITLTAMEATMATTQLTREFSQETRTSWLPRQTAERMHLRMNWVVVTDKNGNRQLRAVWKALAEDR